MKMKDVPATPLSEIKKALTVHLYLATISEASSSVTARILAFSELSKEQKLELITKIERANKLMSKLVADVNEYIQNMAELGL